MKSNKSFVYLLLGQSISNIGDVLYIVSLTSMLFSLTGSAIVASLIPFSITTSMFISSLLIPILVGKINLKYLICYSQLGKTIIMVGLNLLIMTGVLDTNYYLIFLIIVPIALLDGCANPLRQAMVPFMYYRKN
ncbi:hypothetical protein [Bacillus sp. AK128]